MKKRSRFWIAAVGVGLPLFVGLLLPFEFSYYGLALCLFAIFVLTWWALGFEVRKNVWERLVYLLLPGILMSGYFFFFSILPLSFFFTFLLVVVFCGMFYLVLRVLNIFLVTFETKTVPLYRAAYTVGLLLTLVSSFFLFNTVYSFRLPFWLNAAAVLWVSMLGLGFLVWSVLAEQGTVRRKEGLPYVLGGALVLAQTGVVFSFWPLGVILSSFTLVATQYVLVSVLEPELRDRSGEEVWNTLRFAVVAAVVGIYLFIPWR